MGWEFEIFDFVLVGNVLGIGGFESYVLKLVIIFSIVVCLLFIVFLIEVWFIVCVVVELVYFVDMLVFVRGMRLFN